MSKTMTNMSKEEKRMMLFDMQEHPEKYTDEQVEHLFADEEVKEFFHELAMARMVSVHWVFMVLHKSREVWDNSRKEHPV
jgi:nucleoside diphosphate kinase